MRKMYYGHKFERPMTVPTGLVGNKAKEMLCSVIGQMSDGKWENSDYEKYWRYSDIDENNNIVVEKGGWYSGFREMNEKQVRAFWCRKINALIKDFIVDWPGEEDDCAYLSYDEKISVDEIKQMVKQIKAIDKPKKAEKPKNKVVADKVAVKVKSIRLTTLDAYF